MQLIQKLTKLLPQNRAGSPRVPTVVLKQLGQAARTVASDISRSNKLCQTFTPYGRASNQVVSAGVIKSPSAVRANAVVTFSRGRPLRYGTLQHTYEGSEESLSPLARWSSVKPRPPQGGRQGLFFPSRRRGRRDAALSIKPRLPSICLRGRRSSPTRHFK